MNMGRTPHRKPSSDPQVKGWEAVTGDESSSDIGDGESLRHLAAAADAARRDLLACGEMNTAAQSLNDRRARMDEVRRKVAEGYYDRQEIRQMLAERLADNLNP